MFVSSELTYALIRYSFRLKSIPAYNKYVIVLAKLWDARYGEVVHTFEHEHIVKSVNFNHDDTMLLTASNEKLIRVFDLNRTDAGGEIPKRNQSSAGICIAKRIPPE